MRTPFYVARVHLKTGMTIELPGSGVVAVVGPNNSGKTTFLREVAAKAKRETGQSGTVVKNLDLRTDQMTPEEAWTWLCNRYPIQNGMIRWWTDDTRSTDVAFGVGGRWPPGEPGDGVLVCFMSLSSRLELIQEQRTHDVARGAPPSSVLGLLVENDETMRTITNAFAAAFRGQQLALNWGPYLRLHMSESMPHPTRKTAIDQVRALGKLPLVAAQGSGTQNFVGLLVLLKTHPHPVLLIDEPEVSLAAPQAVRLGQELARAARDRQIFIATHSSEILRGVLDEDRTQLTVVRLTRSEASETHARVLTQTEVNALWGSPLLRFTNTLDGLFHDVVVVTENDVDSRFYAWLAPQSPDDVQYIATAGKHNLSKVVRPLNAVGVDVRVVADFDVLREENDLRPIVEALGGEWAPLRDTWAAVKESLVSMPTKPGRAVREELIAMLQRLDGDELPSRSQLNETLSQAKAFGRAKKLGRNALDAGTHEGAQALVQLDALLDELADIGLHVVPTGALESFVPDVGSAGAKWLGGVLDRYGDDTDHADLSQAREFMKRVLAPR